MDIREMTEKKVFSYMEEHLMISPSDRIVAGVSGGADSVCLLFLLLEYAKKTPFSLAVAHVDHGLRQDADGDARFVEELCRQKGLPFFLESVDVRRLALEEKCSEEDAGRRARYEAFRKASESLGGRKVAVAHNGNDNAETMLFHLFRGSGMKGLCGIAPTRKDAASGLHIIRPILCLERKEVEAYLEGRGIPWRTDSTNGGDDYARNRIRHHVLPYAEQEVAGGAVSHMCQTAKALRETEDFLEKQTEEALGQCLASAADDSLTDGSIADGSPAGNSAAGHSSLAWLDLLRMAGHDGRYALDVRAFQSFHVALQKRMLLALAKRLSPTGKDISMVHVQDMLSLFREEANRSISLPFGITVKRQYENVILDGREAGKSFSPSWSRQPVAVPTMAEILDSPFVYELESLGRIEFTAFSIKKGQEVPKNQYTKWFDYDKIEESVVIRSRCPGDYFTISDGMGNVRHKSLKDYMITEKIPRRLRDAMPVVAAGNHVLWLIGWRISQHFKVDGNTGRILQIRCL